ncbi:MAG: hypothetical protein AB1758_06040 [Candidatus Eremiobacterota bacterium]
MDTRSKLEFLKRAGSYPEGTSAVQVVETHRSWVFLTDRHAYKLKKPVRWQRFLDYGTVREREHACREEVRLNRRLAPDVYLGVVRLTRLPTGELRLEGNGNTVDWLVRMRRLPAERMLDRAIRAGSLSPGEVEGVARLLSDFYRRAEPCPTTGSDYLERFRRNIQADHRELAADHVGPSRTRLERTTHSLLRFLEVSGRLLQERAPHVVEGHGDLRPEHICLETPPVIIDALEFYRPFRLLDPLDELCLLWLECERLGAADVGARILGIYTADPELLDFYRSCHGLLRAKLALWHAHSPGSDPDRWSRVCHEYFDLAERHLPTMGIAAP